MSNSTGIKGLDYILGHSEFPPKEAENGFRLLIRGVPGTGKTTLGLHLINYQLSEKSGYENNNLVSKGLIIYLQEEIKSLDRLCSQYQLLFKENNSPDTVKVAFEEYKKNFPFIINWINKNKNKNNVKLCIFIDGLSLAKSSFSKSEMHKFILRLLTELPRKNVFLIIAAEDSSLASDNFFQHLVDCVVDLTISQNNQRHRFIELKKCRYIDFFRGKHGFELFQNNETKKSTLQVYPNPVCLFLEAKRNDRQVVPDINMDITIPSGIHGLEKIVRGNSSSNFLRYGDTFVITVEPGIDKTGFGLSFLTKNSEHLSSVKTNKFPQKCIWLSFGNSLLDRNLKFDTYKNRFKGLSEDYEKHKSSSIERNFIEIDRPSIAMHPDRILYQLTDYISKHKNNPTKVIVDGLNNIGREFENPSKMIDYTIMIIRILRQYKVAAILFIDLAKLHQGLDDIPMSWAEEADFVGHLGLSSSEKGLTQTFTVTKSRYPGVKSKIYELDINKTSGRNSLKATCPNMS